MSADLISRLRATSYLHHRGPNYEPAPVPPSALALEAADALEAALSERDAALAEIERLTPLAAAYDYLEAPDAVDWKARATALEKALRENFCPRPCNGRPDDLDVGDCVDFGECGCMNATVLSAKGGET